jgi:hypothetical protein
MHLHLRVLLALQYHLYHPTGQTGRGYTPARAGSRARRAPVIARGRFLRRIAGKRVDTTRCARANTVDGVTDCHLAFDALHCRTWPQRHTSELLNQSLAALNCRVRDLCVFGGLVADLTGTLNLVKHGKHTADISRRIPAIWPWDCVRWRTNERRALLAAAALSTSP